MKNLFITGPPRIGKSTIIAAVAESIPLPKRGFITVEIRDKGIRTGFEIYNLNGERGRLSHVSLKSSYRVGKYGVDVESFEQIALPSLQPSSERELIIIDEVGKMECFSDPFKRAVRAVLEGPNVVLGTVAISGEPFIHEVRNRTDVMLIEVNKENRNDLPRRIARLIRDLTEENLTGKD